MGREEEHPEDQKSDHADRLTEETKRRLAAAEAAREPIERDARNRDKVDDALAAVEEATLDHEIRKIPETGRREILTPNAWEKKLIEGIEGLDEGMANGWEFSHRIKGSFDSTTADPKYNWKIIGLGDVKIALRRKKSLQELAPG
ncbi:MAG: hypothetical protein Q7S09_02325 [bacterium]|nr:hypothetical protein [bacterium]